MSIEVTGIDTLEYLIQQAGARAQTGVAAQMKKEAEKIRDLARKFAPLDEGNLEDAIEMSENSGGRNQYGQFMRKSYSVFVNMNHPAPRGKTVGDYAYIMHEHLAPYGPLNLGEKSRAKQSGQSEMVGGLYMDRAIDQVMKGMMGRLSEVARSYL